MSEDDGPRRRGRPGYDLDSLLAVSVDIFTRKGFDGTTMADLAAGLGISKSAIYHHVASKEELLGLALNRALDGLDAAVSKNQRLRLPPDERLATLIHDSVEVLFELRPFVTLLLRVHGNSETEREAIRRRREFDRYVAQLVTAASADGTMRPAATPEITARLLFGMVNSLIEWARPRSTEDVRRLSQAILDIAFQGLHRRA